MRRLWRVSVGSASGWTHWLLWAVDAADALRKASVPRGGVAVAVPLGAAA